MTILHVTSFEYPGEYRLRLQFDDATEGEVDLAGELEGAVFRPLKDPAVFAQVRLEDGALAWPNGADMAPEFLKEQMLRQRGEATSCPGGRRD